MHNGASNEGHRGSELADEEVIYQREINGEKTKRRKFHLELKCLKCISMTGSQRLANSLMQAIRLSLSICLCRKRQTMDK